MNKATAVLLLIMTICGIGGPAAGALNPDPATAIPRLDRPPSGDPDSWPSAARLAVFTADGAGSHRPIPVKTEVYLAHDGINLYAGWVCRDPQGLPAAWPRRPDEDLSLDESVQIVLGLPDSVPAKTLEMGGYAGAQGVELAPVAHYYEFTVNAAGAISRRYNETPLPAPRFSAVTAGRTDGRGWTALMTIPLAAAGITPEEFPEIHFNAFRIHRAQRFGWFLPAFGNYAAMPFGRALLDEASGDIPVKRETAQEAVPEPEAVGNIAVLAAVSCDYYPLQRRLCAVFPPDRLEREGSLRFGEAQARRRLSPDRPVVVDLELPELPPDFAGTAVVALDGEERAVPFATVARPGWYGTRAGAEYIDQCVPYPWTPPQWHDGKAVLAHAEIDFGGGLLPQAIAVGGRPLLAGGIELEADFGGGKGSIAAPAADCRVEATRIDLWSSPKNGAELRATVDFDGFTVIRLRFPEADARRLGRLTLRIPLAPGVARFINRGTVQQTALPGEWNYTGNGGDIWVGNESLGLGVAGDRRWWFSPPDGRQVVLERRPDGGALLTLNLVTAPGQVELADQVFQFFLIPTPTRTAAPPPREDRMALWFEEWSDYQGYPDLAKLPEVAARAAREEAEGRELYLYFSQCLAENAPGAAEYGIEWFAPPVRQWYRRAYDPGKDVPCRVSCFRGAAGDLLLDGVEQLAQAGIGGVYLDGTGNPFDCANPSHRCADSLNPVFDDDVRTGRILGQRQFLKRLRGIFDARGRRYPLWLHTGGALDLGTLSLVDFLYEGEQLARFRQGYLLEPERFLVGYSGRAFGFRSLFLPMIFSDASGIKRALAWGLVHDVEVSLGGEEHYTSPVQEAFFALPRRDPEARFHPYWEAQPELQRLQDTPVLISYYLGADTAMLAAANLRYVGTQKVELDLGGFFAGDFSVEDLSSDRAPALNGSRLSFEVPEGAFRLFVLRRGRTDTAPRTVSAAVAATAGAEPEWRIEHSGDLPDAEGLVAILGIPGHPEARAEALQALPAEFTLRFTLRHDNCFRLRLNDLAVTYDNWSGWRVEGLDQGDFLGVCSAYGRWLNGTFYQAADRDVEVALGIRDGRVTLIYDGRHLLDRSLLAAPAAAYRLALETWGGHRVLLDNLSCTAEFTLQSEARLHPVP